MASPRVWTRNVFSCEFSDSASVEEILGHFNEAQEALAANNCTKNWVEISADSDYGDVEVCVYGSRPWTEADERSEQARKLADIKDKAAREKARLLEYAKRLGEPWISALAEAEKVAGEAGK